MTDFARILEVKKAAQGRLLALQGVHSVAIGAKVVAGERTAEPAIVIFVERKKPLSELGPHEIIPTEIEGIKTDVVEKEKPRLFAGALPDEEQYSVLESGFQVQGGTTVTAKGTLGCIGRTDEPDPKIVGITCQHVFAFWEQKPFGLQIYKSGDLHRVIVYGTNIVRFPCTVLGRPSADWWRRAIPPRV